MPSVPKYFLLILFLRLLHSIFSTRPLWPVHREHARLRPPAARLSRPQPDWLAYVDQRHDPSAHPAWTYATSPPELARRVQSVYSVRATVQDYARVTCQN